MKQILFFVTILITLLIIILVVASLIVKPVKWPTFGLTFSRFKAEYLNLDWRETYLAILDDLKVRQLRLAAYWPDIESQPDSLNFSNLDWQIDEAEKRGAKIILAVGLRLPGWPECHLPDWAKDLDENARQKKILDLISQVVKRYKNRPSIKAWQVENEPFLKHFGLCPELDQHFFEQEIALVRFLDSRPIIVSASGELSTWLKETYYADILGITIYRVTWNKYFKYFYYPYPAVSYYLKGQIIKSLSNIRKIIVVELQAEPWAPEGKLIELTLREQYKTMNLDRFKKTINYAKRTGFDEFYLWGGEWWYWLQKMGDSSIWQQARELWISQ